MSKRKHDEMYDDIFEDMNKKCKRMKLTNTKKKRTVDACCQTHDVMYTESEVRVAYRNLCEYYQSQIKALTPDITPSFVK